MSKASRSSITAALATTPALPATRRSLFGIMAGSGALLATLSSASAAEHPDAAFIAACEEYLRVQWQFEAYCATLTGDMEADDPGSAILGPVPALRDVIATTPATTAEGYLARAKCAAFHYLPQHRACQDDPDGAIEDRVAAAQLRDLVAVLHGPVTASRRIGA